MEERIFREMRRKRQQLSEDECIMILENSTSGTLALIGDGGYPYAVPLSYVYSNGKIFFHSALTGHKIDAVKNNEKVSFCVIDKDDIKPEKFTTYYRSVIIFGKARILNNDTEKRAAIELLTEKYSPDFKKEGVEEIEREFDKFSMIEILIEHITGKQGKELVSKEKL
ncbi:MAG: pyridoxamine 5'-phosphate oxidase family protein [Methanocorpusculum sp.]|nr:pyridoxamine 5'-phosphate oxidase family protein [Methanocorpusculum sp.]